MIPGARKIAAGAFELKGKAKAKKPPRQLSICSATAEIMGSHWPQTSTIWAGLRLHEAWARENGPFGPSHHLAAHWCHVNDTSAGDEDAIYRLYAKDERYRFVKARNGAWILELANAP